MSTFALTRPPEASAQPWRIIVRGGTLLILMLAQVAALDSVYSFRDAVSGAPSPAWRWINDSLQDLFYAALYAGLALCVLAIAENRNVGSRWLAAAAQHRWGRWFGAQLFLLAELLISAQTFQHHDAQTPWVAFILWMGGCALLFGCSALALAPLSFWRSLFSPVNLLIAAVVGAIIHGSILLSQDSWHVLSAATMNTAYAILHLYEPTATMDLATRQLGAGAFVVDIQAPCSGYEGIGMVFAVLGLYVFAFRRDLRFPHVLALLPIGAATIWVLNAARLALLVSIGAHISPSFALDGFHTQAGWVMFLIVTVSLMVLAHRAPVFRASNATRAPQADPAVQLAAAMLAPFAALMAARIGGALGGPDAHWLSASMIALPAAAIWIFGDTISAQLSKITLEPAVIGLMVGALWITTQTPVHTPLELWLSDQTPVAGAVWLALRIFGFAFIVPLTEELLFRGYLHRALLDRRFEAVTPGAFSWLAFITTSVLFGAMHGRWLAGAMAGAAFAIALYRSKTLTGPIVAHITANGLIALFAIDAGRLDLL